MNFELTKENIDRLKDLIIHQDEKNTSEIINSLHAADIASIYEELDTEEIKYLFLLLEKNKAANVLVELEEEKRKELLKILPAKVIAKEYIEKMESDNAADVIDDMEIAQKKEVLSHIDNVEQAGDIIELLSYDEDTAGGIMAKEMIVVNKNWTVLTCLKEISKQAENISEIYYVYIVDNNNLLQGTLSLKKLLLSSTNTQLSEIYSKNSYYVNTEMETEEVSNIMQKYNLVAIPVIDSIGRLRGRITIDDVVDVITEKAEKDYNLASGLTETIESSDKIWRQIRARLPWLLIGLLGGVFSSLVIASFETAFLLFPLLVFFIPLNGAMGGNAGVQSSAIIVQCIANNTLKLESTWQKLIKEFMIALINASVLSLFIFIYNYFFNDSFSLAITVSISLVIVIIFASLFGTFIPIVLNRLKIDPALATGPFIQTVNDIVGLLIYFTIANYVYLLFGS